MAFKSLREPYLEDSRKNCKLSSCKIKKSLYDTHILPHSEDKPINKTRPADIRKWQNIIKEFISSEVYQRNINR